ncbi:hypothetical protein [Ferroacidibacillus organovorans]|uniref:Urease accessory protein UreH-like transmembrane domain-containing protein n=1 Tax=Ferroacidibacillus organovorans TaxID=1765683 RepID=A0A853KGS2_9BACL|nr:hypothetical protein AYJ22_03170 [Ferroacidibacillus organovorans]OAG94610.1 hypothetical protein AYW79_04445 [Ferroacidibacillus organovorans]
MHSLNFWYDPHHITWLIDLVTVFLMGIVHGITPDEHTWPITFSYSIGSYSTRGGMRAGLFFSLAFTLQRAIASELAYFALAGFLMRQGVEQIVYVIVGVVMLLSGYFILYRNKTLHLFPWLERLTPSLPTDKEVVPVKLALIHGFIAGWGTGAFATIIYTVISPRMPSAWVAFLPGLLYGLGTLLMQIVIGAVFGRWIESRKLGDKAKAFIGRFVAGNTLLIGGILFAAAGAIELLDPKLADWALPTGLHIYNLDSINVALLLIILVVGGAGGYSIWRAMRQVSKVSDL